jgi:hypothetical protein
MKKEEIFGLLRMLAFTGTAFAVMALSFITFYMAMQFAMILISGNWDAIESKSSIHNLFC